MSNGAQLAATMRLIHAFNTTQSVSECSRGASGHTAMVVMARIRKTAEHSIQGDPYAPEIS
ncbi:hypothetical protein DVH05_010448 [Phytophthora capsici]|nr:hypothetical protein DVH05_010448 [Phytophthora capsici]